MKIYTNNAVVETKNVNEAIAFIKAMGKSPKKQKMEIEVKEEKTKKKFGKQTHVLWTKEEDDFIKKNYDEKNHKASIKLLVRSKELIRHSRLGVETRVYNLKNHNEYLPRS